MVGEYEIDACLQGVIALPPLQRDLPAYAANELISKKPPLPRVPYSDELRPKNIPDRPNTAEPDDVRRPRCPGCFEDRP